MLILEERSYNPKNFVERLTDLDRKNVHEKAELNPSKSVLLPRAFKKTLLEKVFKKIPLELFETVSVQDHAIIYHECFKITKKLGIVDKAIRHMEPSSFREIYNHYYSWGVTSYKAQSVLPKEYNNMFSGKLKNRVKIISFLNPSFILTIPIIFFRGLGYYSGFYTIKFKESRK